MNLSLDMRYYIVGVPNEPDLWLSERLAILRQAIHASTFKEYRGSPSYVSNFDRKKITIKPFKENQ